MPKKILRVFPRHTSQTPIDDYVRIGEPEMFLPKDIDEIHISVLFTWDIERAKQLVTLYSWQFPDIPICLGGPAYGKCAREFIPGKYVKKGITITTRGCDFACSYCLVRLYEGDFRHLKIIESGNIIQDNNILLSNQSHFKKVCEMLKTQKQIRFLGGLDKRLLRDWHVEELRSLRIKELWFAFDTWEYKWAFINAIEKLKKAGFTRNQLRCYVLAGWCEPIQESEGRLKFAWDCGTLPFIQVYQDINTKTKKIPKEDKAFVRTWSRPAAIKTVMKDK